jgi:hypothetical protein
LYSCCIGVVQESNPQLNCSRKKKKKLIIF